MRFDRWILARLAAPFLTVLVLTVPGLAWAQQPSPWQMGFQTPGSPVMEQVENFHVLLVWIISGISLLVLVLLAVVCTRFRASANATPSRRTHHTTLEIAWTALPALILVIIAVPSLKLLYFQDHIDQADMTLKATGNQWFWSYEYPDYEDVTFDAYMKFDEDLADGEPRLLQTDAEVVLPVDTNIRLLVTASDVLHSWAMPSLGVKTDAIPGRLNESWIRIEEPGRYYGQCSELCGVQHGFMPIAIRAVPREEFDAWAEQQQAAARDDRGVDVAASTESAPPAGVAN